MSVLHSKTKKSLRLGSILIAALFMVSGMLMAQGSFDPPVVVSNPEVSAPVHAEVLDVDLRDLPIRDPWKPGDPVKEIPRKITNWAVDVEEPGPHKDPLLEIQEGAEISNDRAFNIPTINRAGQGYSGVNPPDTVGDVGANYFIQSINGAGGATYVIYNKSNGSIAAGPFSMDALGSSQCASGLGDPIILYDELASRWMISEFSSSGNRMCVYVSQTGNPISGGWYAYNFQGNSFPDYPKYGVWPDAYYVGTNESTLGIYAFDRVAMLNGSPATSQRFSTSKLSGFGFQMVTPADLDGNTAPPNGSPGIFMRHNDDEAHGGSTPADYLEIFNFNVNWNTPALSSLTGPTQIGISDIDSTLCGLTSFNCFPQPGTSTTLDPLREVVMNRLAYRNFGTHETLVGNLVTDVNGSNRGGIRWFELRNTGSGWFLYQEGTYSPDSVNRFMGGIAMDEAGNIALGYNVSSSSTFPGLRYVGRLSTDALGTMTQGEYTIVNGSGSNASNRYGDYSSMSVDPVDGCTFWFTGEYNTGSQWSTRIAAFNFASCGGTPTCTYTISPSSASYAAAGGTGNVSVTTTSGCSWTASSANAWITITAGSSGTGNGTVSYSVAANTGAARTGSMTIAGQVFTVTQAAGGAGWVTLSNTDFESGWGPYTDGGSDCRRNARDAPYAHQGTFCARLRDNSGSVSSFFSTNSFNLSAYNQLRIDFWYRPRSMENGEDFFVEFSSNGGSTWQVIGNYVRGVDFNNNAFYNPQIIINSGSYTFNNNAKLRFRCDASGNGDYIYIDEVVVSAQ